MIIIQNKTKKRKCPYLFFCPFRLLQRDDCLTTAAIWCGMKLQHKTF